MPAREAPRTKLIAPAGSLRLLDAGRSHTQQRFVIGRWAEVGELVGVDNRADRLDLTAADVEHHDADQPLAAVEQQRAGAAVDLGRPRVDSRDTGGGPDPVHERARDPVAPAQRAGQGGYPPAARGGPVAILAVQGPQPLREPP